jgi:hypothetical protein
MPSVCAAGRELAEPGCTGGLLSPGDLTPVGPPPGMGTLADDGAFDADSPSSVGGA